MPLTPDERACTCRKIPSAMPSNGTMSYNLNIENACLNGKSTVPSFLFKFDRFCRAGFALLLVALSLSTGAETLRISGTGDALGALTLLADAYMRQSPERKVKVIPSVGSAGAIKGVLRQRLEIGVTSGPLKPEYREQGLRDIRYAATPTVIVVRPEQGIGALSRQLADLYSGRTSTWPDGTPVRPIMRRLTENNFEKVMSLSPTVHDALKAASQREGLSYASSDQEMADLTERIPGAIGISTLGMVLSEKRRLVPLTLDKVAPTPENAAKGLYPIAKQHHLIIREHASDDVLRFVKFIRSEEGQAILRAHGHWIP